MPNTNARDRYSFLIVGAGIQSHAIADYLLLQPDTAGVTFVDRDMAALAQAQRRFARHADRTAVVQADATDADSMAELMSAHDAAISASSYKLNVGLTRAAIAAGCHFVDLGGNDGVVAEQFKLHEEAARAGVCVLPDSGVAPGSASHLVTRALERLPNARSVRIYCGGLPQEPSGPLKYAKFFAMSGLINEYKEDCRILKDGKVTLVRGLDRSDRPFVDFPELGRLEAAYTSGGVSTLVDTHAGRLDLLSYETLRYCGDPGKSGHWDIMRTYRDSGWFREDPASALPEFGNRTPRQLLEAYLDRQLPADKPDFLALMVEAESDKTALRLSVLDRKDRLTGLSAMQRTTGYSAAIEAVMLARQEVEARGVQRREIAVPAKLFLQRWQEVGINVREVAIHKTSASGTT